MPTAKQCSRSPGIGAHLPGLLPLRAAVGGILCWTVIHKQDPQLCDLVVFSHYLGLRHAAGSLEYMTPPLALVRVIEVMTFASSEAEINIVQA